MSKELANQLLEAGVHFGHQTRKWNPKMKRFIYGSKNGVHIINLERTIERIEKATEFIRKTAASGGKILFVGTKPQARELMGEAARNCNMPYVNSRWLGGLLTNFHTLRRSISRYLQLKEMTVDGTLEKISKKEGALIKKEIAKLEKNLLGVTEMEKLPQAMFVIDATREIIAVKEAVRLNIPVVAMIDTDADPDLIQYPIPSNDDAVRSIKTIVKHVSDAILEGAATQKETSKETKEEAKESTKPEAISSGTAE